jgi:serine/threonine protein kinase
MIDEDENPKIIDFGLSKDTNSGEKVETNIVGSKMYMAPEIL